MKGDIGLWQKKTGIIAFKGNYQIIQKKYYEISTMYEYVEKLSMINVATF